MKWWLVLIAAVVSAVIGILTVLLANVMKVHYGAYRRIVAIYVAFLAMTSIISVIAVFATHFQKAYVIMAIGSILFLLSDAVLSNTFFGRGKDKPFHLFINHFLYYAGQYSNCSFGCVCIKRTCSYEQMSFFYYFEYFSILAKFNAFIKSFITFLNSVFIYVVTNHIINHIFNS